MLGLDEPRLRVFRHEEARGVTAARSTGLAATTTPYVAFCDDDDVWAPDKLTLQLDALSDAPEARWSCTSAMSFIVEPTGVELTYCQSAPSPSDVPGVLLTHNVVPGGGSSVLAETDLVRDVGGFRVAGVVEDWDLWIRLGLAAPVAPVGRPLTGYRVWRQANGSRSHQFHTLVTSMAEVRSRYADEAKDLGVAHDGHDDVLLAKIALRCGLRQEAFVRYSRLAREDPKKLAWAVTALVSPSTADRVTDRRSAAAVPVAQRDEVRRWLLPLLSEPVPT